MCVVLYFNGFGFGFSLNVYILATTSSNSSICVHGNVNIVYLCMYVSKMQKSRFFYSFILSALQNQSLNALYEIVSKIGIHFRFALILRNIIRRRIVQSLFSMTFIICLENTKSISKHRWRKKQSYERRCLGRKRITWRPVRNIVWNPLSASHSAQIKIYNFLCICIMYI